MKSIIGEIYNGERGSFETIGVSKECRKVHEKLSEMIKRIASVLDDENKKLLDELYVIGGSLEAATAQSHFTEGFKIGLMIGMEVLGE